MITIIKNIYAQDVFLLLFLILIDKIINIYYNNIMKDKIYINYRISKLAEKNPMWKGDKVGLGQLHTWVRERLPKPKLCECCKKVPPLDLANKGTYNRELSNWEWLCRRCHMTKDGRIKKLTEIGIIGGEIMKNKYNKDYFKKISDKGHLKRWRYKK